MTWAALFRRLWRALVLRFRNFHECPECGVPMQWVGTKMLPGGKCMRVWRCMEDNCSQSRLPQKPPPPPAPPPRQGGYSPAPPRSLPTCPSPPPLGGTGQSRPPSSNDLLRKGGGLPGDPGPPVGPPNIEIRTGARNDPRPRPDRPRPTRRAMNDALSEMRGPTEAPRAFVQWKGTNACMDVDCLCGESGHVCQMFAYFLRCNACGRIYATPAYIPLHEITEAQLDGLDSITFGD